MYTAMSRAECLLEVMALFRSLKTSEPDPVGVLEDCCSFTGATVETASKSLTPISPEVTGSLLVTSFRWLVEDGNQFMDVRVQLRGRDDDERVRPLIKPKPGLGLLMIGDHEFRSEFGNERLAVDVFDRVNADLLIGVAFLGCVFCRRGLRLQQCKDRGNLFLVLLRSDCDEQARPRIIREAGVGNAMVDDQEERLQDCNGGLAIRM